MWSWSQEHALGQVLLYHMESYKELTCEFLASMRYHMYEEKIELIWTKDWDGSRSWLRERREWSKAAQIRSPVLRYVHKALANTFFARKATGTINEGNSSFLTWESSPSLTHKRWQEDQGR
ncbi:unnamed protein product [Microthlaspi erraticum]|uniref:Arabidopsis retrotransposon Orf1 C-terminal domain-containing protein n=1 Tax=Microthlaspi erraticum TaxID=1685480 RepID=A0A6D2JA27_9BRAS|nr:unnamed protein product [Microthlaspi erraticum]